MANPGDANFFHTRLSAAGDDYSTTYLRMFPSDEDLQFTAQLDDVWSSLDYIWLFVGGVLVFAMQLGFILLETGSVRVKNTIHIILKNCLGACIAFTGWWLVGHSMALGEEYNEFIGTSEYGGDYTLNNNFLWLFQGGFAAVVVPIISGTLAERATMETYVAVALVSSWWIYPVAAHWVWGGGWLSEMGDNGILDFAGGGVVHLLGGVGGAVAGKLIGPRLGRYADDGEIQEIQGHSATLSCLGTLLLWFGWYGFNGSSTLGLSGGGDVVAGRVFVNTLLCPSFAGLTALFFWRVVMQPEYNITVFLNGVLTGLVAITPACAFVEPYIAIVIGIISGPLYIGSALLVVHPKLMKIDDPVDAIAVHAFGGLFGLICTGCLATQEYTEEVMGGTTNDWGLFYGGGILQLGLQLLYAVVLIAWTALFTLPTVLLLKLVAPIRVAKEIEARALEGGKIVKRSTETRVEIMNNGHLSNFQFRVVM